KEPKAAAPSPAAPAVAAHAASAPAAPVPVTSARDTSAPVASAPAASTPAASAEVSSAPEVIEWTAVGDPSPATQAADVVPSPTPTGASTSEAANHDDGADAAAPARQSEPAATAVHQQVRRADSIGATVDPSTRPEESDGQPAHEAFWFAVAQHRTAVDPQTGAPAFVIEPGGWVLALEDRGHEFLVQHTDGRVGVLRDLSNIERG
ncbi:MAG TPA: hypothetical protein VIM40_07500, partial [Arthrobacter sp.]